MKLKDKIPLILLIIYCLEFIVLGVNPYSRGTWIAENIVAITPVLILVFLYFKRIRFSNTSYILMAIFIFCHTIGGHYTFELVPFDFVTELFDFQRNHYDRMCHFMVGFFAYPILEFVEKRDLIRGRFFAILMVVMSIFGFAAIFELIEYWYAICSNPELGSAFLGSQGDIWDAQKDMLADGLGAITTSIFYHLTNCKKN